MTKLECSVLYVAVWQYSIFNLFILILIKTNCHCNHCLKCNRLVLLPLKQLLMCRFLCHSMIMRPFLQAVPDNLWELRAQHLHMNWIKQRKINCMSLFYFYYLVWKGEIEKESTSVYVLIKWRINIMLLLLAL